VRRGRVVAFGATEHGRADRVVIVAEPSGTVPGDALADTIRREISNLFGLYVDEVALVPSGRSGERRAARCSAPRRRRASSEASSSPKAYAHKDRKS